MWMTMRQVQIDLKTRAGFSLLEIIMAVGLLSLVSVYMLQIFVTAHRLNQQTLDTDESVQISNTIIQAVDLSPTVDILLQQALLNKAVLTGNSKLLEIEQWYNEKWIPIDSKKENVENMAYYYLKVRVEPDETDQLTKVNVRVYRVKPYLLRHEETTEIYHLSVVRYLPSLEVSSQ